MSKWYVSVPVYASATIEVEADTEEDAINKAQEEMPSSLCWSCANDFEIGDIDASADCTAEQLDQSE